MIGTILTGVFAKSSVLEEYGMSRIQFIGVEVLGVVAVGAFTIVMAFIIFKIIDKTIGLRVTEQEELDGLDGHEHGSSAYADFQIKL